MCVLAFAWRAHPRWRLALIGNRDELHLRPAAPLAKWADDSGIIAGRDLESGGTWLGVSSAGRAAVVTNLRGFGDPHPGRASRGALVSDKISGDGRYAQADDEDLMHFNPFSLITVADRTAFFLTNRPEPAQIELPTGVYGMSNGGLDEPWPKTVRIKDNLERWLDQDSDDASPLLDSLRENDTPQVEPRQADQSPIFIKNPVYGTRCSTVLLVDSEGHGRIVERRYDPYGEPAGDSEVAFDWPD